MAQLGDTSINGQITVSKDPSDPRHVVLHSDPRLGDARTPKTHKAAHAIGGADPLAPGDIGAATADDFSAHTAPANTNPHGTTAGDVGLGSVTNAAQLEQAKNLSDLTDSAAARRNLGLGSAAVKDAGSNGGIATLDANGKVPASQLPGTAATKNMGEAGGVASLDPNGKVPAAQLPAGYAKGNAAMLDAGVAGGVATLDSRGKLVAEQIPDSVAQNWSVITADVTAVAGTKLACDTSAGGFKVTLPECVVDGDWIEILDAAKSWAAQNLTIDGNGNLIEGDATLLCDTSDPARIVLLWRAAGLRWQVFGS